MVLHKIWGSAPSAYYVKIVLTLIVVGLLVYVLEFQRFWTTIRDANLFWLFVGCLLSVLFVLMRILKWFVLLKSNGLDTGFEGVARTMLSALALGIVTPARIGEAIVVAPFAPEERPRAIYGFIFDRLGELTAVLIFCIPALLHFLPRAGLFLSAGIVIGGICVVTLLMSTRWRVRLSEVFRLKRASRLRAVLTADIVATPAYWLLTFATYAVAYALVVAFIFCAEPLRDWRAIMLLPVVTLSNIVSITVGGLGIREGLAAALAPFGQLTPEVAAAAFFLSFFFTRVLPGLVGLAWTLVRRKEHPRHAEGGEGS